MALAVVAVSGLALAACGRVGPRELPPGPAVAPTAAATPAPPSEVAAIRGVTPDTSAKTGVDSQGRPVAGPGQKKPFFLDWLLQ
jgi:predicted small lipoprotein YifL